MLQFSAMLLLRSQPQPLLMGPVSLLWNALRDLDVASTTWPQSLPEGAIPFSTQSLHMESTQVYPPLRACCKCPIRPNESSAQASKERQTIANAQYFSSVIPLPRGRCNYCVGFNIIKPVCSSWTQHPGGPLCWDLWDMVVTTCMTKAWTRKVKWGLLYKYCYNKLICKFS